MATFGNTVNRIANTLKSQNKDGRIPKRYILNVFQSKLEYLITQKLKDKTLFREDNLYSLIECIELSKIDIFTCDIIEFKSCNTIMKSKKKMPKILSSRFGPAVKNVTNIDNSIEYLPTTPSKYRKSKLREEKSMEQYYYIHQNYPILPNSNIERINMEVLTLEPYKIDNISSCSTNKCQPYWDYELPTSDKLTEIAIQETLKELLTNKQIVEDENPNMKIRE